jgi:hypothetical protein
MGIVSLPSYGSDPATVNASNLDGKVDPLATEFNGSIENVNIKTGAAIAASKLNLTTIAQAMAMSSKEFLWAKGADIASGTSIALGTDGNCFDITGTTTIQTITAKQAGAVVLLHFDGALTLTDDTGNLELQGSDLVVSAEDEVIFKSDGTNWHLVSSSIRGTGALNYVSTTVISNDVTIAVTGLAAGYDYIFSFQNLLPQTDGTHLLLRTSTDGGSTYDSGAGNYTDAAGAGASTSIRLSSANNGGNVAGEGLSIDITVYNPGDTTMTHISCDGMQFLTDGTSTSCKFQGKRDSAADVDAVQFLMSSGNLASGNLRVFRRKLSA